MENDNEFLQQITKYRVDSTQSISRQTARLYSNFTRLRQGQKGIEWDEEDTTSLLNDAYNLIEAGLLERELRNELGDGEWVSSLRRAGEILEWLSLPEFELEDKSPTNLLAASAYQIAGYPARAKTLLRQNGDSQNSEILRKFLNGEFYEIVLDIAKHWGELSAKTTEEKETIQSTVIDTTIRSIGIIVAGLRWLDEPRVGAALAKISRISDFLAHSDSAESWLLAKLTAISGQKYIYSSFRTNLSSVSTNQVGALILEKYQRQRFATNKALTWASQRKGISALQEKRSCVICTPTGSGKTTIAEIAILSGLFPEKTSEIAPIVVYLVPKRALAAEVESSLSKLFKNIAEPNPIIVTGLYGGSDWGPTDAWITRDNPVVLICTYEKADALSRFLGPSFLDRISLVVLDEAHFVQAEKNTSSLSNNRQLNLEIIGTRLFKKVRENNGHVIGLSAVAQGIEDKLSQWIEFSETATPAKSDYHSTRHLIGCLECSNRGFTIHYDLLDGQLLRISDEKQGKEFPPYVPNPFPSHPPALDWEPTLKAPKPEKSLRPYTLWAAMQFASTPKEPKMVLISVPQKPEEYGKDFIKLIRDEWKQQNLPKYFKAPTEETLKLTWNKALACCIDYFGRNSIEYQLLKLGIVLHHGKMPSLLARLLVDVIDKKVVRIVLSTTTLSDGVNLPFDIVLIPSLRRGSSKGTTLIQSKDISNLAGRAGRPGISNEGICLILSPNYYNEESDYHSIINQLLNEQSITVSSPLITLINAIYKKWKTIADTDSNEDDFLEWLEQVASVDKDPELSMGLDGFDKLLISFLNDIEPINDEEPLDIERKLTDIWKQTYASAIDKVENNLPVKAFIARAKGITKKFFPLRSKRRAIYYTNLPPSSGQKLIDSFSDLKKIAQEGYEFANWTDENKLDYIFKFAEAISTIPEFKFAEKVPENVTWQQILRWWLLPNSLDSRLHGQAPSQDKIANWYQYAYDNFIYRLSWGLSSFIAYAAHDATKESVIPLGLSIEDWPMLELPWAVFWLKEMITWGTIDPPAAFLLARGGESVFTRAIANNYAQDYYQQLASNIDANEHLNAVLIRDWAVDLPIFAKRPSVQSVLPSKISVSLTRNAPENVKQVRVIPYRGSNKLHWFDLAGFQLADSEYIEDWNDQWVSDHDFVLDTVNNIVITEKYL